MSDKYIFKILERKNEVLLIVEYNTLKFMQEINEDTFKLPYLKNKDLSKFLSKVIDKFQDKTLKFDYTLNLVDSSNLNFKISLWDGNKHTFNILLKSKEVRDAEMVDEKIRVSLNVFEDKIKKNILEVDRKYDDECDNITDNTENKLITLKRDILMRYTNDNYRNYKYKSLKIIKGINKVSRSFEIQEEKDKNVYTSINDDIYVNLYSEFKKDEVFTRFTKDRYNQFTTIEKDKQIYYTKMYMTDLSIYSVLESVLNHHGVIDILYLNIDYNKATEKVALDIRFLYDDSEKRVYKCYSSLFKQEFKQSNLIYNSLNHVNINKKDILDIFIFQLLK